MITDNVAWDLESIYTSFSSPDYKRDLELTQKLVAELSQPCKEIANALSELEKLELPLIQEAIKITDLSEQIGLLLGNMHVYTTCFLTTDPTSPTGLQAEEELQQLWSKFSATTAPLSLFMLRCSDHAYAELLKHPKIKDREFYYNRARKSVRPYLLPLNEEELICALEPSGHRSWGQLWETLSGTGQCLVDFGDKAERMGLAKAASLQRHPDEAVRKASYIARDKFWEQNSEAAAAAINQLAAWRLALGKRRGYPNKDGFLKEPSYNNALEAETIETILSVARKERCLTQEALKDSAMLMGKPVLDPWDHSAPPPASILGGTNSKEFSFTEGLRIVKEAFGKVSPELADFVDLMHKSRWIESRVLDKKRGGAFQIWFSKLKQPRIMQTFNGSMDDIRTLAHELGHAFHSWCLKDLPEPQQQLPSTLAETASNFAEACVAELLDSKDPQSPDAKSGLWMDLTSGAAYILNIPARFCFEKEVYSKRDSKRWSPADLTEACQRHFMEWYGCAVDQFDPHFWAWKGHFYISGSDSFYNFPYIVGYLLSQAIFARRKLWGTDFFPRYKAFLLDTGRMTLEEVVKKHLDDDATSESFWYSAFASHNEICRKFRLRFLGN
jgi:oligoendopeptidase F